MSKLSFEKSRAQTYVERLASTRQGAWLVINVFNPVDRFLLRRGKQRSGVLFLHHVGAKTGLDRQTPLMCIAVDDHWILAASKGGDLKHPAWYHNVIAHPDVAIDVDGQRVLVRASELDGEEYDRMWRRALNQFSGFARYQARAGERTIPLIRLDRRPD